MTKILNRHQTSDSEHTIEPESSLGFKRSPHSAKSSTIKTESSQTIQNREPWPAALPPTNAGIAGDQPAGKSAKDLEAQRRIQKNACASKEQGGQPDKGEKFLYH